MRSKVKFLFRDKDHKHAFIEPASIEIKKALEKATGKSELIVEADSEPLALRVAKRLLQIEILNKSESDPSLHIIQEEIIDVETARLLLTLFRTLENSSEESHKEMYGFIKNSLSLLKHVDLMKAKEKEAL